MPKRKSQSLDSHSDFSRDFFELVLHSPYQRQNCIDPLRPECLSHHLFDSLRVIAYTKDVKRYERAIDNLFEKGFQKLKGWIDDHRPTFEDEAVSANYTAREAQEIYCEAQSVIDQAQDVARGLVNSKFHDAGRHAARGNELSLVEFGETLFPVMEQLRLFVERINRKKQSKLSAEKSLDNSFGRPREESTENVKCVAYSEREKRPRPSWESVRSTVIERTGKRHSIKTLKTYVSRKRRELKTS